MKPGKFTAAALVAPHAGAWIEIYEEVTVGAETACRSPCGSVD